MSNVVDHIEPAFSPFADVVDTTPPGDSCTRQRIVFSDDGTRLAVREVGPSDSDLTFVFVHGLCQDMQTWTAQWSALQLTLRSPIRAVFYDQRGHGRSDCGTTDSYTIDQLGNDLAAVVQSLGFATRVVLVGHSMGGMSVLAYARQHEHMFGAQIVGVGLLATAANGLTGIGLGTSLSCRPFRALRATVRTCPEPMRFARARTRKFCPLLRSRAHRFGPKAAAVIDAIANATDLTTMFGFLDALESYDEARALQYLARVPVTIVCGSNDPMTPPTLSRNLAEHLPHADHVTIQGASHMVQLERPEEVAGALGVLVGRIARSARRSTERTDLAA